MGQGTKFWRSKLEDFAVYNKKFGVVGLLFPVIYFYNMKKYTKHTILDDMLKMRQRNISGNVNHQTFWCKYKRKYSVFEIFDIPEHGFPHWL
jgi:hypothetical protein